MKTRVKKRGSSYQITAVIGHDSEGAEIRRYYTRRTKKEAEALAAELQKQAALNTYSPDNRSTVAEFAARWQAGNKTRLRPATRLQYDNLLRLHILPVIGGTKLAEVSPVHVQEVVDCVTAKGRAPKTVRHVYTTLRAMLGQAVKWRLLGSNPCALVDAPRVPRREAGAWSVEQTLRYLAAMEGEPLYALFYLTVTMGFRRGEVLGLRWSDIADNRLPVTRSAQFLKDEPPFAEVKTEASVRRLALSPATQTVLREHRKWQREFRMEQGLGRDDDCLIFHSRNDTAICPSTIYRAHRKAIAKAGLPYIPVHGLRHTAATILLSQGTPLLNVSRQLGHSDIQTTANVYGHVLAEMEEQTAATMDKALAKHSPQNLHTRHEK